MSLGFKCCESDHSLSMLHVNGDTLIVVIYVDDIVITSNNLDLILGLKRQLVATFEMTNLGLLHYFLGHQIFPLSNGIFISQSMYALDLFKRFNIDDYKLCAIPFQLGVKLTKECSFLKVNAALYQQLVSSLIYLTHSQPILSFVVSVASRFMQDP